MQQPAKASKPSLPAAVVPVTTVDPISAPAPAVAASGSKKAVAACGAALLSAVAAASAPI